MEHEKWRAIRDLPGYEVSNCGRVRSVPRIGKRGNARFRKYGGNVLVPQPDSRGYAMVCIYESRFRVHRLVLGAFSRPPRRGEVCRHLDGNIHNNHHSNLAWGSYRENSDDSFVHGTMVYGERHPNSVLTQAKVELIRNVPVKGGYLKILSEWWGIHWATIYSARIGQSWKRDAYRAACGCKLVQPEHDGATGYVDASECTEGHGKSGEEAGRG